MPIQVLHVGPTTGGGVASVLVSLAHALRGFPDLHVDTLRSTVPGTAPRKLIAAARAARRIRRGSIGHPRIVHLHAASGSSFYRKSLLLRAARGAGAHTVLHVHGGAFEAFVEHAGVTRRWIDATFRLADLVLAVNAAQQRYLAARFHRAVELFPNAVRIPPASSPPSGPVRLLHLARLGRQKGTWDLLEALEPLRSSTPPWELVLAGDGDVEAARRRAEPFGERVRVLGWQEREEADRLLEQCHVFVLPSYVEGLPMSVLEVMARGRAVITSRAGGLPELITCGIDGTLVSAGDIPGLTAALHRALTDEPFRRALASAARQRVETDYNLGQTAARLRDLYRGLVA